MESREEQSREPRAAGASPERGSGGRLDGPRGWGAGARLLRGSALLRLLSGVRVRLTLWYVSILALVLLVFSVAVYTTEQQALLSQLDRRLDARLRQLSVDVTASGRLASAPSVDVAQGDAIALLLTPAGRVVQVQAAGPLSAKAPWSQVVQALAADARSPTPAVIEQALFITIPNGTTKDGRPATTVRAGLFRLTGARVTARHGTMLLVVGLRSDMPGEMASLARTLGTVAPLVLLLCAGGGYWLADRALRPVRAITRTARQIGATDLSRRLGLRRRDELGELAATFDHMLDRLEAAFERQRQFTADASHELRTPLAVVELEATRALAQPRPPEEYRRVIAAMQRENGYMARLVDDLLTLARADSGQSVLRRDAVDLNEVALDVAERLTPLARRSGLTLRIDPLPELPVWGDEAALTRALTNLVENALIYSADIGTQVRLSGECGRQGERKGVWLRVRDDGPGIAAEHLPHLCERFYRVDNARTRDERVPAAGTEAVPAAGSGLGLAITRWIVQAHGGSLRIQSEPGRGSTFEIWLPVSAPDV